MSTDRETFEAIFSRPPYEFDMARFDDSSAWPGNYRNYNVQCTWDGFREARERAIPSAQPAPLDRSDAVNLARNLLEVRDCKGITERGVRVLCDAVMAMDQALTAAPAATQAQAEPVAWMAFATLDGRPLALPEYAAADAPGVMGKVLDVARKEGFRGTGEERMQLLGWWAAPVHIAPSAPVGDGDAQPAWPMKDHELRELVNTLRDVAIKYHATQQLRERIAQVVHPWARPATQPEGQEAHPDTERLDWLERWHDVAGKPEGHGDTGIDIICRVSDGFLVDPEYGGGTYDMLREAIDAARAAQAGGGKS